MLTNTTLNCRTLSIVGRDPSPLLIAAASAVAGSVAVLKVAKDGDGTADMQGTALCVDPSGLFLTSYHYVPGIRRATIVMDGEFNAEPVAVDEEKDLALFAASTNRMLPVVHFAAQPLAPETEVIGVGHVQRESGLSLAAYAAKYAGRLEEFIDLSKSEGICAEWLGCALLFDGNDGLNLPGFSGGPLLNMFCEVVALTSGGDGESFVTAVSADAASELVAWYRARH